MLACCAQEEASGSYITMVRRNFTRPRRDLGSAAKSGSRSLCRRMLSPATEPQTLHLKQMRRGLIPFLLGMLFHRDEGGEFKPFGG